MQLLAFGDGPVEICREEEETSAAKLRSRNMSANPAPSAAPSPTCRQLRRVTPLQFWFCDILDSSVGSNGRMQRRGVADVVQGTREALSQQQAVEDLGLTTNCLPYDGDPVRRKRPAPTDWMPVVPIVSEPL